MRPIVSALALATLAACSAAGPSPGSASSTGSGASSAPNEPTISSDETWSDGKEIPASLVIAPNVVVTIAAGATIHAAAGAQITIQGTLKAAGGAEATITGTSATATWGGLLVDKGGTLALTNVDLASTSIAAISVNAGALAAAYDTGTITASAAPFAIQAGAKLTTSHATVKGSVGTTRVQGELDASYLDYDANGQDGITAEADTAVLSIEDSELHGISGQTGDMIVSYQGAGTIHVAYTEIKNVHCAFHIQRMTNLDVSFVNATGDSYGFMLYGSLSSGTRKVDSMNIDGELEWGIDEEDGDINGAIAITNCYFANNAYGDVHLQTASNISITGNATAAIADAHPR
jgi:hypothetical protein